MTDEQRLRMGWILFSIGMRGMLVTGTFPLRQSWPSSVLVQIAAAIMATIACVPWRRPRFAGGTSGG